VTAYEFIREKSGEFAVTEMTALLGVSRAAYYKWSRHGTSNRRAEADAEVLRLIREIVEKHKQRYGSPRVREELRRAHGVSVSGKRVARLMRENGLNARVPRKQVRTTDSNHGLVASENVLDRNFTAERPGEKWVSDITYLRTLFGWVYLTVVIDLFDRKVIGWAMSSCMDAAKTSVAALRMAVANRRPLEGLIFHSDRGVQYCARLFRKALALVCPSVRQSMSRKGNCWDNACAESFFGTLKRELDTLDGRHSAREVRQSVFMYIETYYNKIRRHSALDYSAPDAVYLREVA